MATIYTQDETIKLFEPYELLADRLHLSLGERVTAEKWNNIHDALVGQGNALVDQVVNINARLEYLRGVYVGSGGMPADCVVQLDTTEDRVILRYRDKDGTVKDMPVFQGERGEPGPKGDQGERGEPGPKGDQGEKGDTGGSIDLAALERIEAIQQALIKNGSVYIGGQAEFATVTDYEGGGKNLTTEGSLGLNANNVVVNGASFSKDGNFTKIAGVSVPEDADPYFAVNKKYVDEVVANAGGGSATPVNADWNAKEGEEGYIKNRTHYITGGFGAWVNTVEFETDDSNKVILNLDLDFPDINGNPSVVNYEGHPTFVIGDLYKIWFNGKEYTCEAYASRSTTNTRYLAVGNSRLANSTMYVDSSGFVGGGEEIPFFVIHTTGASATNGALALNIYTAEPSGEEPFTLSIERMFDNAYVTLDPNYLPDSVRADKLEKRLPGIIDERIAQSGSGGGSGGGLSYEEFNVYVPGCDVHNTVLKCKKWNYGLLEIEGTCTFTPTFCDEMESLYTCGSLMFYFRLGNSITADPVPFIKAPTFAHCGVNSIGMFANSSPLFGDEVHMNVDLYSIIPGPDNPFDVPMDIYVRGYWK